MSVKISELTAWVAALAADEFPVSISGTTYKIALTSYFIPIGSAPVGSIVGTTDTQTLSGKTLTAPKIANAGYIADANGAELIIFTTTAAAANELTIANAGVSGKPTITASGGDANITMNLVPKGTGTVQVGGVDIVTLTGSQTLTNKTLTSPTLTTPALGTPASGNLSNCTAYSVSNLANAGTGILTFLGSGTSANLAGALSDEVGYSSGAFLVFNIAPTIKLPIIADTTTVSKTVGFDISTATASTQTTLLFAQTVARTITFPNATDTLVGLATTDTLTNKTLTAPKIANAGFIADANGNELIVFTTTASATNEITFANAANSSFPSITVSGSSDSNVGLSVKVKGTGAFFLDSTTAAATGNARGANAVDLQTLRTSAGQVASGTGTFAAGNANTVSNSYSGAIGNTNTVNSLCSFAAGETNGVSGSYSASLGINNSCSATSTFAFGSTAYAVATFAQARGSQAYSLRMGQDTFANGKFSALGDAQVARCILRKTTTDATQTELTLDGATPTGTAISTSNRFIIPASTVCAVDVFITGCETSSGNRAFYNRRAVIYRNGSNATTLVGLATVGTDYESNAAWDVTLAADDTNESLQVLVTGVAATTIRWTARVEFSELGSP